MSIAKVIEISSQSTSSFDDAAMNAYKEASRTIKNIKHIYIKDFEIQIGDNGSPTYRTNCKVTFVINSGEGVNS